MPTSLLKADGTPLRVLLVDDHTLVRSGIRALLDSIEGVEVAGEAGSGERAISFAREVQPDLVLMDISMPDMDGLAATAALKRELPEVKIVILSMHNTGDFFDRALHCGASGYMLKDAAVSELETALLAVMRGDVFLSPSVSRHVVERMRFTVTPDEPAEHGARPAVSSPLTPRQTEILQLIGLGHSTKDIARRLGLAVKTVEAHRAQIMERLEVRDIANLLIEAARRGLIKLG